jgi:hypothetical protein
MSFANSGREIEQLLEALETEAVTEQSTSKFPPNSTPFAFLGHKVPRY